MPVGFLGSEVAALTGNTSLLVSDVEARVVNTPLVPAVVLSANTRLLVSDVEAFPVNVNDSGDEVGMKRNASARRKGKNQSKVGSV